MSTIFRDDKVRLALVIVTGFLLQCEIGEVDDNDDEFNEEEGEEEEGG